MHPSKDKHPLSCPTSIPCNTSPTTTRPSSSFGWLRSSSKARSTTAGLFATSRSSATKAALQSAGRVFKPSRFFLGSYILMLIALPLLASCRRSLLRPSLAKRSRTSRGSPMRPSSPSDNEWLTARSSEHSRSEGAWHSCLRYFLPGRSDLVSPPSRLLLTIGCGP